MTQVILKEDKQVNYLQTDCLQVFCHCASLCNKCRKLILCFYFRINFLKAVIVLGPIYTVRLCRMRQRLTTGPQHDLRLLCTSEKMS